MPYIIAEIGNNHNGSLKKCLSIVNEASRIGVDAIKLQSFRGIDIVSPRVKVDEYDGWDMQDYEYWYQFADSIALPLELHQEVIDYTHRMGLDFITTPVSVEIVEILEKMNGIDKYKVASMDLNNIDLLISLSNTNKDIILSTGMVEVNDIKNAVDIIGSSRVSILHCVSDYPLRPKDSALNNIKFLKKCFPGINIGYSDHSLGHELSIAATSMGASIIEKHITLDRNDPELAEHHFSLNPVEFGNMVKWVRVIDRLQHEESWGRSSKEKLSSKVYKRSFHYKYDLSSGHIVNKDDLVFIRPGTGIGYKEIESVIGKKLLHEKKAYDMCSISDV